MVVKVVANKGVEYKEYKKDGKHRIYFKDSHGQGRPVEIGNYDLIEGRFFSDRKFSGPHWDIVESADDARALIVIGGERQVFVGPRSTTTASAKRSPCEKQQTWHSAHGRGSARFPRFTIPNRRKVRVPKPTLTTFGTKFLNCLIPLPTM